MSAPQIVFSKDVPRNYHEGLGPALFAAPAHDMVQRVRATLERSGNKNPRILELACGTGIVSALMADAFPDAEIIATDISEDMLAIANERSSRANIKYSVANMVELPFGDSTFDLMVCQFGVMFPPNKAAVFAEAQRVLRVEGSLLFSTWDKIEANPLQNAASRVYLSHADILGDAAHRFSTPFSMYEPFSITAMLKAAGFAIVEQPVCIAPQGVLHSRAKTAAAFSAFLDAIPSLASLREGSPDAIPRLRQEIEQLIESTVGPDGTTVPLSVWVFSARKTANI